ncbi:MAG: glucokinase [Anaerolineae bacterium]
MPLSDPPRHAAVGLDLGGSSAKIGLVADSGEVLAFEQMPFTAADNTATVLDTLRHSLDRLQDVAAAKQIALAAVGCGVSGNLDAAGSTILLNNVAALNGFPLRAWLIEQVGLPAVLDNDACLAALAEVSLSAQMGRTLFVTVGSGIGVVLLNQGAVVRVAHGVTGEAGHIIVAAHNGQRCPLGCCGCLETVASGRAIEREGQQAAAEGRSNLLSQMAQARGIVTSANVAAAMVQGDAVARAILEEAGHWLGLGMASWTAIYQPEQIILGGGVSQAGEVWQQAAVAAMTHFGIPNYTQNIQVSTARLGHQAGVIGAGLAALKLTKNG